MMKDVEFLKRAHDAAEILAKHIDASNKPLTSWEAKLDLVVDLVQHHPTEMVYLLTWFINEHNKRKAKADNMLAKNKIDDFLTDLQKKGVIDGFESVELPDDDADPDLDVRRN